MKKYKTSVDSEVTMSEVVFPNDTNPMGIVQGGRIIQLMDIACAICAQTHAQKIAVTVSIDKVSFIKPAKLGDILTIKAKIARAFKTSMEIYAAVWAKRLPTMESVLTTEAYFTFVALDEQAKPTQICDFAPSTSEEKRQFKLALKRKSDRTKIN
ncbi:MAG: acyl-CoA thioesterase [Bacteroidetes bacterium]|nr:acyl-CoA thioesterase [Bacteroidota bacterium]